MNNEVIVTCAVTGAGDTLGKHPEVPVTPEQISNAAIAAAKAGASVAHIHVRDPETGLGSRDVNLFKEVVERIRDSETDVVINLTAGMGGDWVPSEENPSMPGPGTDMIGPEERLAHVKEIHPEICSLDCGTMNFGNGNEIYISPPGYLREMASMIQEWGVKPELEVFELGQIRFAKQMIKEGLINEPPMFQICLGIPWGAEQTVDSMKVMKDELPTNASWASFGIGRMQMPMAAAAVAMGIATTRNSDLGRCRIYRYDYFIGHGDCHNGRCHVRNGRCDCRTLSLWSLQWLWSCQWLWQWLWP